MPKISVIVPVYNVEKYLNRCVDSLLNQTYKDFELILVDDGSPDNSGKICDEYAIKDSRVKVIHKKNGGVSSARNAGLDNASGEYVSFIDADDWIEKDTLELLLHETIENRLDVCSCGFIHEYVNLKVDYQLDSFSLNFKEFLEDILNIKGNDAIISTLVNKIYLKKIIDDNNIRLLENLSFGEDNVFVLTYYKYVKRVGGLNSLLYHYDCSVENSAMKKIHLNANDSINCIDDTLTDIYKLNGLQASQSDYYIKFISSKWIGVFRDLLLTNICLGDKVEIIKTWIPTIPSLVEAEINKCNTDIALFINKLLNEELVDDIIIKEIKTYIKKENRIALKNKIKISIKRIFFRRKK